MTLKSLAVTGRGWRCLAGSATEHCEAQPSPSLCYHFASLESVVELTDTDRLIVFCSPLGAVSVTVCVPLPLPSVVVVADREAVWPVAVVMLLLRVTLPSVTEVEPLEVAVPLAVVREPEVDTEPSPLAVVECCR